ncbi:aquaporin Z [Subtercola sp. Z020]|uniref:aquaporin n=1 Tax=Subtercola sp. Z020 TaxID=2080582 RepID=UPI000CE90873|nr:aquaporin [Subtercola sp. Z020]PPF90141.1 aquaporin Z [Subtercola sp. Z020]
MTNPQQHPFPAQSRRSSRSAAEFAGTFLLVFGLIGAALLTSPDDNGRAPQPGTGLLGVALALGLAVTAGGFAFGPVSGGHFNPAVTLGTAIARRLPWRLVPLYVLSQALGGLAGAAAVFGLVSGAPGDTVGKAVAAGFASNGFDGQSPGLYGLLPVAAVETVATAILVLVVLATTHPTKGTPVAPLVIGLTLTVMLFVALPIDNASLNPARSLATAAFGGPHWLAQLWVFIVFPLLGAAIAALLYPRLFAPHDDAPAPAAPVSRRTSPGSRSQKSVAPSPDE